MAIDALTLGVGIGGVLVELLEESEASRFLEGSVGEDILSLERNAMKSYTVYKQATHSLVVWACKNVVAEQAYLGHVQNDHNV